jgi:Xaa-Pro aminopeptidase
MKNYILLDENAVYYECGFSCDNVVYLKLGSEGFFITDSRYTVEANEFAKNCNIIQSANLIKTTKELLKKNKIKKLVFDPNDFKLSFYQNLTKDLKTIFIPKINFSKLKRIIKSDEEIQILKKASKIGKNGFKELARYIQKNGFRQKENFLHFKAVEKLSLFGKYDLSFDPIVAINRNAAKPHALPTKDKLKLNDLILVDAGVKYKRYCSDRTCTSVANFEKFSFKREQKFKNKKHQKIYDIVLKAQLEAINKTRSGMKASKVDKFTRDYISKAGYGKYFVHSTGHGVGLDIHEFPSISAKSEVIIEDNMVFAPKIQKEDLKGGEMS